MSCKPTNRDEGSPTLNQKYENTQKISQRIRELGYSLVEMWECAWKSRARDITIPNTYKYPTEHIYRMSEASIIKHIQRGEIFGAVEVDIGVPDHLKEYFAPKYV